MAYFSQPTDRSPALLLSFPRETLQSIIGTLVADELFKDDGIMGLTHTRLSCRVVRFCYLLRLTRNIRGVCSTWASTVRYLLFRGKSARHNLVIILPRLLGNEGVKTFPLLRDCMVQFCHPYRPRQLYFLQQDLAKTAGSLEYICGVSWEEDDVMDCMMGRVGSMGYTRMGRRIVAAFADQCIAAGLPIADCNGRSPNGRITESSDGDHFRDAAITALKAFLFKEVLALWYYNAHIVRQILGAFPRLEYLVLPDFLHLPLLAKTEYFFPQASEDTSPFAPVTSAPPQILQTLGIRYMEGGRPYSDIMAPLKCLSVMSPHYNPILALFNRRTTHRCPSVMGGLLKSNHWMSRGANSVGGVVSQINRVVDKAVYDLPDVPRKIEIRVLRAVMDKPTDD